MKNALRLIGVIGLIPLALAAVAFAFLGGMALLAHVLGVVG